MLLLFIWYIFIKKLLFVRTCQLNKTWIYFQSIFSLLCIKQIHKTNNFKCELEFLYHLPQIKEDKRGREQWSCYRRGWMITKVYAKEISKFWLNVLIRPSQNITAVSLDLLICGIYINDLIWSHHNLWGKYIIISFGEEALRDREIQDFSQRHVVSLGRLAFDSCYI